MSGTAHLLAPGTSKATATQNTEDAQQPTAPGLRASRRSNPRCRVFNGVFALREHAMVGDAALRGARPRTAILRTPTPGANRTVDFSRALGDPSFGFESQMRLEAERSTRGGGFVRAA